MDKIKEMSRSIAREISERGLFDVEQSALMIEMRLDNLVPVILSDYKSNVERRIDELRHEAIKVYDKDRQNYVKIGLQIARLKSDKAVVNRAMSDMIRNDKYARLRDEYVRLHGEEEWKILAKSIEN